METISCIFCGCSDRQVVITENGYTGVKCTACRLIYITPRPSAHEVVATYSDTGAAKYANIHLHFAAVYRRQAMQTLSKIRGFLPSGSILELGPGSGAFLLTAKELGYDVAGIELNPYEAAWLKDTCGLSCENTPLSAASFGGRRFDLIYHRDVLSHLHDPIAVFKAINRTLRPGGWLVFETGNTGDLDRKYYKYFAQFLYPDHLFFFGERSIEKLLAKASFRLEQIQRINILPRLIIERMLWKLRRLLREAEPVAAAPATAPNRSSSSPRRTLKRKIREWYRRFDGGLAACGRFLPSAGRPCKLLVFAQKVHEAPVTSGAHGD